MKQIEIESVDFLDERFYPIYTPQGDKILDKNNNQIFYPSATHILQEFSKGYGYEEWLKIKGKDSEIISLEAKRQGTKVHKAIENLLNKKSLIFDDNIYNELEWASICNFCDFFTKYKPKLVLKEAPVYSYKYKYAGRLDNIFEINGKFVLFDYKIVNNIFDTYLYQLAAYLQAAEETYDLQKKYNIKLQDIELFLLNLKAKTKGDNGKNIQGKGYKAIKIETNYKDLFDIFLGALKRYYFKNPNPKPKNLIYPATLKLDILEI